MDVFLLQITTNNGCKKRKKKLQDIETTASGRSLSSEQSFKKYHEVTMTVEAKAVHSVDVQVSPLSLARLLKQMVCGMCSVTADHLDAVRPFQDYGVSLYGNIFTTEPLHYDMVTLAEKLSQSVVS